MVIFYSYSNVSVILPVLTNLFLACNGFNSPSGLCNLLMLDYILCNLWPFSGLVRSLVAKFCAIMKVFYVNMGAL